MVNDRGPLALRRHEGGGLVIPGQLLLALELFILLDEEISDRLSLEAVRDIRSTV